MALVKMPSAIARLLAKTGQRRPPCRPEAPPQVDHSATRAADPYDFEAAHTRLAWMLRLAAMTNVGLIAVVIVLVSAISELVPLKEVQLGLIRIEPRSDHMERVDPASLVRVLPVTKDTPGYELITEAFVRRYIRVLLEIDTASQDDRMREANLHSDAEWWKRFIRDRKREIDKGLEIGLNRSVNVETADLISERNGVRRYAVELTQTDERDGKRIDRRNLRAYVVIAPRPQSVRPSEKFENPSGLRVLDVSLKDRGNS
ncbi:VirB8/TrbF family protein [Magnetospirillum sp. 15-1]|uniref:VirB8/TrbF family protein n=1 Tax=Magnetospirillum sp. 15-1 TaxID=1979370 RepID=UPI001482D845|nr:VirB8/TrbF family protein [Magnetospirillum sp. 15-1]